MRGSHSGPVPLLTLMVAPGGESKLLKLATGGFVASLKSQAIDASVATMIFILFIGAFLRFY